MVVVILFRLSTVDVNARFDGNDCVDDGRIDKIVGFVELGLPAVGVIEFLFGAFGATVLFDRIANGLVGMVLLTTRSTMVSQSYLSGGVQQHPSFDIRSTYQYFNVCYVVVTIRPLITSNSCALETLENPQKDLYLDGLGVLDCLKLWLVKICNTVEMILFMVVY